MRDWAELAWPAARLSEALSCLGGASGYPRPAEVPPPPDPALLGHASQPALERWLEAAARRSGFEAAPTSVAYADVRRRLARAGPSLVRIDVRGEARFVVVLRGRGGSVSLLTPRFLKVRVRTPDLAETIHRTVDGRQRLETRRVIDTLGLTRDRAGPVCERILKARLSGVLVGGWWTARRLQSAPLWRHLRDEGLLRLLAGFVAAQAAQYGLWVLAWMLVGRGALSGRFDPGWLQAWVLVLLTIVPVQLGNGWVQGRLWFGVGRLMKRKLFSGALRLDPDSLRQSGIGQLLGRVIESESVETLALTGGFVGLFAVVELTVAALVLGAGAAGPLHGLLLVAWTALVGLQGARFLLRSRHWTDLRLAMTNDLVESFVGHQTLLAQERLARWLAGQDQRLDSYLRESRLLQQRGMLPINLSAGLWLLLGLAGLAPSFARGDAPATAIAISLGGVLLAHGAFRKLSTSITALARAAIAGREIQPLLRVAGQPEAAPSPEYAVETETGAGRSGPLLVAAGLSYRYPERPEPVLSRCSLTVEPGDHLLLTGPSGGGKSTLGALLTGLRAPTAGLLLLEGLDHFTLGLDGWRRRVAAAPQFHENHVITETLAFNLLMGRGWPPSPEDMEEADEVCRALGLGELIDRMPAGLLQVVGETGWHLSHGERSRLYIARTLLQRAKLLVLDESFAALDPGTLARSLDAVLERAPALLVIAHP